MQSREEAGQHNMLSLQMEKRNAERRLAEAHESLRKSDVMIKHLTQDKVDLESELEMLRIVNASLRCVPDEKQGLGTAENCAPQETLDSVNAQEHQYTLQRPHKNKDNALADVEELQRVPPAENKARDDNVDVLPRPVAELVHARQSDIDRGKLLTAVGELQDSLSARARRSRPCTPRLHPASREAGLEREEAHVTGQEDVEADKQRAIQAAIRLRASLCSK